MGMDVFGANEGTHFRANCWGWRPIIEAIWEADQGELLSDSLLCAMGFNDGAGLRDEADCHELADKLEHWVNENVDNMYSPDVFKNEDGTNYYGTSKGDLLEFVTFLRECGEGFEVW